MFRTVVWGTGGHAGVILEAINLTVKYEVVALIKDIDTGQHKHIKYGIPVLDGLEQVLKLKATGVECAVIALGDTTARYELGEKMKKMGFKLPVIMHNSCTVSPESNIGEGTVILAGSIVGRETLIGRNCIVNTRASVDHDCKLGDAVHIAPGVTIGGHVNIGDCTWVGIGSTVKDHITIGPNSMVGAGSVVINDLPGDCVAFGAPARVIRSTQQSK